MDTPLKIAAIDWEEMWVRQTALHAGQRDDENGCYERAWLAPLGSETSTYTDELLSRMELRWNQSVLDIGCGNGAIATALARRVRSVTALDADPRMLAAITHRALAEGITNLHFIHARWEAVEIGRDIEPHDVALASRFFPLTNLRAFIERMNRAATALCYLTWIVGEREEERAISEILGTEHHPLPEYGIIYNLLYTMGLHPSVEIFESRGTQVFRSIEEAVHDLTRGYQSRIESAGKKAEIESWVKSRLSDDGGLLRRRTSSRWALIGWRRS